jgi:NAD(P)-dependent dehydrogenase (short-subunit alcohol dehydrogenase family)
MREVRADLRGRTALVTGGRVKIGHELALRMLRDGARVVITTRFAIDAAQRFAAAPDFDVWRDRLRIHRLDLRHLPAVEAFACELSAAEPFLDILVNNAAQTVRRPPGFYRHLLDQERHPPAALLDAARPLLAGACALPAAGDDGTSLAAIRTGGSDAVPADGRAVEELEWDGRATNSWTLRTDEVDPIELVEVQLVGAMAPFLLCSRLRPLLARSPAERRFIVNVSAMEGQFARAGKTVFHPHTNMAKAALNMLTRTAAADYAAGAIYMNSVDTGWITDENPLPKRMRIEERDGFVPPLDIIDGAARVYHPIALGISAGEPLYGMFLKDYRPYPW